MSSTTKKLLERPGIITGSLLFGDKMIKLKDYQSKAIRQMHNGCLLCGGTGSGKSITALAYYFKEQGILPSQYGKVKGHCKDLYVITTPKKRDSLEWQAELSKFCMSDNDNNYYGNKVIIDSWNNIAKYVGITNSFFIFDEQRVIGNGAWVKSFLKIAKANMWILLSATPGDKWEDYIPVFIANGFYKNKTEFSREHLIYSPYTNFPKIDRYVNTGRLIRLRRSILVDMDYKPASVQHHEKIYVDYDQLKYKKVLKERFNEEENRPFSNAAELCFALRKVSNTHPSRSQALLNIVEQKGKVIVFYNYDYELDILLSLPYGLDVEVAQWNGHKHQEIPDTKKWVYLVQYIAGAEGWNCIKTDTIVFYSPNYSYRTIVQCSGRIDRLNTPYKDLFYYHLVTHSSIDFAISKAVKDKKKFNEGRFVKQFDS